MTTLVGGVGELFQGDLDLGRLAAERLSAQPLGPDVVVEELHYGALAVVQRIQELDVSALVLVGAIARGRPPGTLERRRVQDRSLSGADTQRAVEHAATGYVDIDLVLDVATGLQALPARTVSIEVEPARVGPSPHLSDLAARALGPAVELVRAEVRRVPLLELAERIGARLAGERLEPTPAVATVQALLAQLQRLDLDGRYGRAFGLRDRLRLQIARGRTGEGMDHLDWGLWWALIEELDRLERLELIAAP